jgi:hypothetical protein
MGMLMSIFCSGDGEACGDGEAVPAGICMPGMFSISDFADDCEVVGAWGCDDVCAPLMSIPGMPCLNGAGRVLLFRRTIVLAFRFALRLAFGLALGFFDMSIPGILCIACP